jgi:hypothetical protein
MEERLDKSVFKKQTHTEAGNNRQFWLSKTVEERLVAAYRLSLRAYGLDPDIHPKLDKTYFRKRTRE